MKEIGEIRVSEMKRNAVKLEQLKQVLFQAVPYIRKPGMRKWVCCVLRSIDG